MSVPESRQGVALARLPPEKQLDVAMYGVTNYEPPYEFAGAIAENWKSILPVLRTRMDAEVDEYRLVEYMMILFSVSVTQCSLANRQDILAVAAKGLPRIKPPFTKLAEEQMEELRNPQKPLPPCE